MDLVETEEVDPVGDGDAGGESEEGLRRQVPHLVEDGEVEELELFLKRLPTLKDPRPAEEEELEEGPERLRLDLPQDQTRVRRDEGIVLDEGVELRGAHCRDKMTKLRK